MNYYYDDRFYDRGDDSGVDITDWAHCLYEAPEGEIVLCADCAQSSGREDIELIEQSDNEAPCVMCRKTFADLRHESIAEMYDDDPSPDEIPF